MVTANIIVALFCACSVAANNKDINLFSQSLLLYFDNIESKSEFRNLSKFCQEREYTFTVYYRVLYFRFCEPKNSSSPNITFDNFCDHLETYYSNEQVQIINDEKRSIKHVAKKQRIFGHGLENDELFEAHQTCNSVREYFRQKKSNVLRNKSQLDEKNWLQQPHYTEWYIADFPFCLPTACGFTESAFYNRSPSPSAIDCVPLSCKPVSYITICIDALIALAIALANILIFIVVPKTNFAHTPHG